MKKNSDDNHNQEGAQEKEEKEEKEVNEKQEPNYEIQNWDELEEMDVSILRGIYAYGYEKPSPIQRKAIKPIMMGKDIIAQAQS